MGEATADAVASSEPVAARLASDVRRLLSALDASPLLSQAPDDELAAQIVREAQTFGRGVARDLNELIAALEAIGTFKIVLFGRTGVGKSSLIEAMSSGNGASISPGETDWTTKVCQVPWASCEITDTPGTQGWGREVATAELEERARRALVEADVVLLCFDTYNQEKGEFTKVADWVAEYGKPAIAVLNCRNPRWGDPEKVPHSSWRAQLSRDVASHERRVRQELTDCGLPGTPVVAVHAQRAVYARAAKEYAGPRASVLDRLRRRSRPGWEERLLRGSNLPALECLLIAAIETDAVNLRLGRLLRQVAGTLDRADSQLDALTERARRYAGLTLEPGIERVLAIVGRPDPSWPRDDEALARLVTSLEALETARGGGLGAVTVGSAERHFGNVVTARLSPARTDALTRAVDLVDEAAAKRRILSPKEFSERVVDRESIQRTLQDATEEAIRHLRGHIEVVTDDMAADVREIGLQDEVTIRGAAGKGKRAGGIAVGAIAVLAPLAAVGVGLAWTPVGWGLLALAVATTVVSVAAGRIGRWLRRGGNREREEALAAGHAAARQAVYSFFDGLEAAMGRWFIGELQKALMAGIAETIELALLLRWIARWADDAASVIGGLRAEPVLDESIEPAFVLREAQARCEREANLSGAAGRRKLWLGESWCDDPVGLGPEPEEPAARPLRRPFRQRIAAILRRTIARATVVPRPDTGRAWLTAVAARLDGDDDSGVTDLLGDLARLADDPRPRLVLMGDYSAGKSSFVRRLLVDAGEPVPPGLKIGACPSTHIEREYEWEGMTLVDTPGFQSGQAGASEVTLAAIRDAAAVICMFAPNLVVGDRHDLDLALRGDPERGLVSKHNRTLYVVNRFDELGCDPVEDPDEFEHLWERKRIELAQALSRYGPTILPEQVIGVASDPFGLVGDRPARAAHFDRHRSWDGFDQFSGAFARLRPQLAANGVDVTILEGGLARFGRLSAEIKRRIGERREQLRRQDGLRAEASALREQGLAIVAERTARLERLMSGFVTDLIRFQEDRDRREAAGIRVEQWTADPVLQQLLAEWHRQTTDDARAWHSTASAEIIGRVSSRDSVRALPELAPSVVMVPKAKRESGLHDAAKTAGLLAQLLRQGSEVAGEAAGVVADAAPVIQFGASVLELVHLARELRIEGETAAQRQAAFRTVREEATQRASVLAKQVLRGMEAACVQYSAAAERLAEHCTELREEIEREQKRLETCWALMVDARRALGIEGGHDDS
jgi:predicted GTPase